MQQVLRKICPCTRKRPEPEPEPEQDSFVPNPNIGSLKQREQTAGLTMAANYPHATIDESEDHRLCVVMRDGRRKKQTMEYPMWPAHLLLPRLKQILNEAQLGEDLTFALAYISQRESVLFWNMVWRAGKKPDEMQRLFQSAQK